MGADPSRSPPQSTPSSFPSTPASSIDGVDVPPQLDDVAIIGMACRAAGGNTSPEKLWQFIMDKKDASGEVPSWRWDPWVKRDPRNAKVIEKTINKGYFIQDLENFDAAFFGISPKEAEQMDPHQRLGLEVTWEALENAGINPQDLAGSDTAVYMGVDSDDYSRLLLEDLPNIEAWMGIGTTAHGIPNRISYHLDLMGPSSAVDAACASSLIAVHCGRRAIQAGESKVAIVGGANVCLSPALFHMLGSAGALSPDGVCQSFDDEAHGYARGEGAAILVLKRLSDAIADGDRVLATIKGTAIAQDGKTNGIMAPNAKAQEIVARKALKESNIDPLTVGYIEAHATSTSLGDPTEISAISAVYGKGRPKDAPAAVGSIKPNVGHLEAAAGTISLIKAVMAVNKAQLPPQTRLNKLNSRVDWEKSGLQVVRESGEWIQDQGLRRAAVCSYGYGGTVSHAVIEQSPVSFRTRQSNEDGPTLLVLSAPQEKRLPIQSAAQAEWISADGAKESLTSIAATLAQRRAQHDFRAAFVVSSHEEAAEELKAFTEGKSENVIQGRTFPKSVNRDPVWVFSGHGAQWPDMGKELLQNDIFRKTLEPLDRIVSTELGYSAIEKLQAGDFEASDEVQVMTYLMQAGLIEVLKSKGIQPQAVIGHSVGEIAAAVAAGCLTAEEGTLIVTRRARLYAEVKGTSGMYLVNRPFAEISKELGDRKDVVAAIDSSPSSCVVSGGLVELTKFVESLKERGAKTFQVKTDIAFHSPMLDVLSKPLVEALTGAIKPKPANIKLYSTSQKDARSQSLRDIDYWVNNMINPVWLNSAVNAAADDGFSIFLEVSSHPIVAHSINETLEGKDLPEYATVATMKKKQSAEKSILGAVAELWTKGSKVDFTSMLGEEWSSTVPGFQWSQKRFWKDVATGSGAADTVHDVDSHAMLGQRTAIASTNTTVFTTTMNEETKPFPRPHQLHGTDIIPAAVYVNTFKHATGASEIFDMALKVPLAITNDDRDVQVVVEGNNVMVASRLSSSKDDGAWVTHSSAHWTNEPLGDKVKPFDIDAIKKRIGTQLPSTFSIDYLTKVGVAGIAFPWAVLEHFGNGKEMIAKVDSDPDHEKLEWNADSWAPTLDAASSVGATIFSDDAKLRIVSQIDKLEVHSKEGPPKVFCLYVTETEAAAADPRTRSADVSILDLEGELLAKFQGIRLTEVDASGSMRKGMEGLVHQMAWVPARLSEKPLNFKQAVLITEDGKIGEKYQAELQRRHIPNVKIIARAEDLAQPDITALLSEKDSAVIYCPGSISPSDSIAQSAHKFIWQVSQAITHLHSNKLPVRFFIVTDRVYAAETPTALAQGPLYGLARVVALEHSDIWGGLIDNETPGESFPAMPMKYVQEQDVIRFVDGVPRIARFRPFTKSQRHPAHSRKTLLPKPEGTYVMTGGLGALGLQTCDFLIEKGARRIVIVSRRALPPRNEWSEAPEAMREILERIQGMEKLGASIHVVSLDVGAEDAHERLLERLSALNLPPVLGVVHASGVLEDSLLVDTTSDSFARVLAPKISGALTLHRAFPPKETGGLDFFVVYSSIGQLVGTSGQSSYASGNAFLDTLAAHRRTKGDNAFAFQWTAWRGLGMATSTDFLTLELQSKGITDVASEEAFRAWEHMSNFDVEQAVVTRILAYDEDEPVPCSLIEDVVVRRPRAQVAGGAEGADAGAGGDAGARPAGGAELKGWLDVKIRESVASILKIDDIMDIDGRVALADLGVDSVMTIALRQKLQSTLKVKVPQTLVWNHPTVSAQVDFFGKQFEEGSA